MNNSETGAQVKDAEYSHLNVLYNNIVSFLSSHTFKKYWHDMRCIPIKRFNDILSESPGSNLVCMIFP